MSGALNDPALVGFASLVAATLIVDLIVAVRCDDGWGPVALGLGSAVWVAGGAVLIWAHANTMGPALPSGDPRTLLLTTYDQMIVTRGVVSALGAVTFATLPALPRSWRSLAWGPCFVLSVATVAVIWNLHGLQRTHSMWGMMDGRSIPARQSWDAAKTCVLGAGAVALAFTLALALRGEARAPRSTPIAIAVAILGALAFVLTRGHHHDARHPLDPHGLSSFAGESLLPHPTDEPCEPPFFGRFVDLEGTDEAELHAIRGTVLEETALVSRPPSAEGRQRAEAAGFRKVRLVTKRTWSMSTATRGDVTLSEPCASTVP